MAKSMALHAQCSALNGSIKRSASRFSSMWRAGVALAPSRHGALLQRSGKARSAAAPYLVRAAARQHQRHGGVARAYRRLWNIVAGDRLRRASKAPRITSALARQ